jgi:hypothetical protein
LPAGSSIGNAPTWVARTSPYGEYFDCPTRCGVFTERLFVIGTLPAVKPVGLLGRLRPPCVMQPALVPKPRVTLTRFHGAFAPNSNYRERVTWAKRGRGGECLPQGDSDEPTPAERRAALSLKRSA